MLKKFLAFLTTLAMVFAFVGCSGGESPETAVTNYLTAFQNLDLETIDKYTNDTSETTDTADVPFPTWKMKKPAKLLWKT